MAVTEVTTLAKRFEFEHVAVEAGWAIDKHTESTDFGRSGWRINVRWIDVTGYPGSFAVVDPHGHTAKAMSFLADEWAVGGELLWQLKAPGPLRDPGMSLELLLGGFLELLNGMDAHHKFSVEFIAEKVRDMLEAAAS